jgi:hypothetical protein
MKIGAKKQAGKRKTRKMHYLVVSLLAGAYLTANVFATLK